MREPALFPFFLLFGLFIASLIGVLSERHDQEQPTDCDPEDVPISMRDEDPHTQAGV